MAGDQAAAPQIEPGPETDRPCHGNIIEHASRAKTRRASCRCDSILPLCGRFGSEGVQCGSGDEVALKVEGVVNRTVHVEEALGGSEPLLMHRVEWRKYVAREIRQL
jgi:hypothetical protein